MKKGFVKSTLLPLLLVPIGGVIVLGTCYMLYYGFYLAVDALIFSKNPSMLRMDLLRITFTVILFFIGLLIWRTKWPDLLKVILLTGPLTMLFVTSILTYYMKLTIAVSIVAGISLCSILLVHLFKKPWIYYYAIAVSIIAGIYYAWPR